MRLKIKHKRAEWAPLPLPTYPEVIPYSLVNVIREAQRDDIERHAGEHGSGYHPFCSIPNRRLYRSHLHHMSNRQAFVFIEGLDEEGHCIETGDGIMNVHNL